jgi:hypothetical protein
LKALLLATAIAAISASASPGFAQSAAPSCETFDHIISMLDTVKAKHVEITTKSLLGVSGKDVDKLIVASVGGSIVLGIVGKDGCVSSPIALGAVALESGA